MHLGKPLQRRVIVPRTETLTVPEADERPPATAAEPAETPVSAAAPAETPVIDPSVTEPRPAS